MRRSCETFIGQVGAVGWHGHAWHYCLHLSSLPLSRLLGVEGGFGVKLIFSFHDWPPCRKEVPLSSLSTGLVASTPASVDPLVLAVNDMLEESLTAPSTAEPAEEQLVADLTAASCVL